MPSTGSRRPEGSGWALIAAAAALAPLAVPAGATAAATGGESAPRTPRLKEVVCVEGCAGLGRVTVGGLIQVGGRSLAHVTRVVFGGGVAAPAEVKSPRLVEARVPAGARSGRVALEDGYGGRSRPSRSRLAIDSITRLEALSVERPLIQVARSRTNRFYYGGRRGGRFQYLIASDGPLSVRVDAINQEDGAVVRSWLADGVEPFRLHEIEWDGTDALGAIQREGRYTFKLSVVNALGVAASRNRGPADGTDGISFFRHIFPIRGSHDYGEGGARFGAGRAGHSHQGQDVFARCGTPLAAARGGLVKWNAYHPAAGRYLVIDGAETGVDYVYMHLQRRPRLRRGQRVYTGQPIGNVGDTGNARGCHLHFEMWSGSGGWYDGGRPFDPAADLRAWDGHS